MPGPFGVTADGFNAKTTEEIKAEIDTAMQAQISATLDVSTAQPIGQINGIMSSKLREVWELAQGAYDAFDPDMASGFAQTVLMLLTGTQRKAATRSTVTATVNLDAGTYLAGTLIASVLDNPDSRFANVEDIIAPGGNLDALFQAEDTGPILAPAGTLTVIAEPVPGWNSVTNAEDAEPGADEESDASARQRREDELARVGSTTKDAIRADVLVVESVQKVTVYQNDTSVTDGNGVPGHAIEVIVYDGNPAAADDDAIAQAIWDSKAGGIESFGSESGTAKDFEDNDQPVKFSRVDIIDVWLEVDVDVDPDIYEGDPALKAALVAFGDANLDIGEDVINSRLVAACFAVVGVLDVLEIRMGFTVSPVSTANLSIGIREIAALDTARIMVTAS